MSASFRSIRLGVATGVMALALAGVPAAIDGPDGAFTSKAALADAGGNGKGKGNGHGKPDNPGQQGQGQQAKANHGKAKVAKDDPMHPSNLGRLNGFLNASPQALMNTSPNSAIGILSKSYADALAGYLATDDATTTTTTVTEDDLAAILAKAANKPLTGEQIVAINEKLMSVDPELAEAAETTTTNPDGTTTTENTLTDPELADDLAERANEIQASETNQGLGSGDDADDSDDAGDAIADAADTVGDAATDAAEAVGDFFNETF